MRRAAIVLLVLSVSVFGVALPACGAEGESRPPVTTVENETAPADEPSPEAELPEADDGPAKATPKEKKKEKKERGKGREDGPGDDESG